MEVFLLLVDSMVILWWFYWNRILRNVLEWVGDLSQRDCGWYLNLAAIQRMGVVAVLAMKWRTQKGRDGGEGGFGEDG